MHAHNLAEEEEKKKKSSFNKKEVLSMIDSLKKMNEKSILKKEQKSDEFWDYEKEAPSKARIKEHILSEI
jgi:hypothetical protein